MKLPPDLSRRILTDPANTVSGGQVVLPRMTEAAFTAFVIGEAQIRGWLVAHFRGVRVQRKNGSAYWQTPVQGNGAGFPDLILVRGSRMIAAELKVGRNVVSAEQRQWLQALGAAGAETYEWRPGGWPEIELVLA